MVRTPWPTACEPPPLGGTWPNPYNATTNVIGRDQVTIDHIVALCDAYESGAKEPKVK
ncbi:hypothetical protein K2224_15385 [Streptomyces sp. BHT-5-2]|uniref:hypothetical protein n=1 Tax=unclassified Streptomyces TaxID=2593676 RepID=UPI001C8E89BC|nr:hypothetical protein [Streptomyces sp. BHT-5-2]QZL04383.1 hypothetical protein K2224_15385 [Streptomyces sp. BHT-5-2]